MRAEDGPARKEEGLREGASLSPDDIRPAGPDHSDSPGPSAASAGGTFEQLRALQYQQFQRRVVKQEAQSPSSVSSAGQRSKRQAQQAKRLEYMHYLAQQAEEQEGQATPPPAGRLRTAAEGSRREGSRRPGMAVDSADLDNGRASTTPSSEKRRVRFADDTVRRRCGRAAATLCSRHTPLPLHYVPSVPTPLPRPHTLSTYRSRVQIPRADPAYRP